MSAGVPGLVASSIFSGVAVSVLCTPFDVVKHYWQFNPSFAPHRASVSVNHVVKHIYRNHGFKAFWTGLRPAMSVIIPSNILFFGLYEHLKTETSAAVAGVQSRSAAVLVTAPLELIRTRVQAQCAVEASSLGVLSRTVEEEGLRSLWRGCFPTLVRDVPFSAVYWQLNEIIRAAMHRSVGENHPNAGFATNFVYPFVSGGVAAGIACVLTHPFDVIKTNMQAGERVTHRFNYKFVKILTTWGVICQLYKDGGIRAFGVGLFPRVAKIVPSCAVLLASYESFQFLFKMSREEIRYEI